VDASNGASAKHAAQVLVEGSRRLLAATLAPAGRWHVLPVPRARLQTVACADVARAIADVAEAGPRHRRDVRGSTTFAAWLAAPRR
jgi:hypothetical protein